MDYGAKPAAVKRLPAGDLDHILEHTAHLWSGLRGARIFVTGGTGFFGSWLLESFLKAEDGLGLEAAVTVLTRSPEQFRRRAPHVAGHPAVRVVAGDVRSFVFPEGRYTHVIHGAAESNAALYRDQPLSMLDTLVDGTRRVLDFAVAAGARRFLLLSSGKVYGADCADAGSVYAEGKRMAEMLAILYARNYGVECAIARGFAFAGPGLPLDTHFAIGNFISDCMNGRAIEIRGDGTALRSYLYAADLAVWLWTILARGESGRPYDVGSVREVSVAELAATVASVLAPRTEIRVAGVARPGAPVERYVPDTQRARTELGLREIVPLEEAIRRTAEWYSASMADANEMVSALEKPE